MNHGNWRVIWEATENGNKRGGISAASLFNLADCRTRMKQIIKDRPSFTFTSCKAVEPGGKLHPIDLNRL